MSKISRLENEISGYRSKIQELESEIRKNEQNYDSLQVFKGKVEASHEEFENVNGAKKNSLNDLEEIKKNSVIVQRYQAGMSHVLNGIGSKMVAVAYLGILFQISAKMREYINNIQHCEEEIRKYRNSITNLNIEIQDARNEERQRQRGGNRNERCRV